MGAPGQAKTGGRKAGTPNKKTAALKQAVVEAVGALPDAFEGDSYAFLATVYKNHALPLGIRLDAAKTAIAYERARLAHVAMTTRSLTVCPTRSFSGHGTAWRRFSSSMDGRCFWRVRTRCRTWLSATRRGATT